MADQDGVPEDSRTGSTAGSGGSSVSSGDPSRGKVMRLGGYEIIGQLGKGAMGAVYLAKQMSMDREVAIKVLPKKLAKDETFVRRFIQEAKLAATLMHPNLVTIFDCGQAGDHYFYSMELVKGKTLLHKLKAEGPLSEEDGLRYLTEVAGALQAAHDKGIIHRDIKPANVMLDERGNAKVGDLGLAKPTDVADESGGGPTGSGDGGVELTQVGDVLGTPAYMSPEQCRGKPADERSDLYSLGATFFHLLSGERLFAGETAAMVMTCHITEAPPSLRDIRPELSAGIEELIDKLLAKRPADRYQSASEVLAAIVAVRRGDSAAAPRRASPADDRGPRRGGATRPRRGSQSSVVPAPALIGIGAVVLALGGFLLLGGGGSSTPSTRGEGDPVKRETTAVVKQAPIVAPRVAQRSDDSPELSPAIQKAVNAAEDALAKAMADAPETVDWLGLKAACDAAVDRSRGTALLGPAGDLRAKAVARWKSASREALRTARTQAEGLLSRGDIDAAIAVYTAVPAALRRPIDSQWSAAEQAAAEYGFATAQRLAEQAQRMFENGNLAGAMTLLDELAELPNPAARAKVEALTAPIVVAARSHQAEAQRQRRSLFGKLVDPILTTINKGRYGDAIESLGEKTRAIADAEIRKDLRLLQEATRVLEGRSGHYQDVLRPKIGQQITIPTTGDEQTGTLGWVDAKGLTLKMSFRDERGFTSEAEVVIPWERISKAQLAEWDRGWKPKGEAGALARYLWDKANGKTATPAKALAAIAADRLLRQHLDPNSVQKEPVAVLVASADGDNEELEQAYAKLLIQAQAIDGSAERRLRVSEALEAFKLKYGNTALAKQKLREIERLVHVEADAPPVDVGKPLTSNLVAYWGFDKVNGAMMMPNAGTKLPGRLTVAELVTGVKGPGLRFTGKGKATVARHDYLAPRRRPWTVACWVRTTATDGVIVHYGGRSANYYQLRVKGGKPEFAAFLGTRGAGPAVATASLAIDDGNWHHLAAVRAGPSDFILYVDGNPDGVATWTERYTTMSEVTELLFGAAPRGKHFTGDIDEVQIYQAALSKGEIKRIRGR